jgi:translation initiation factor eIF-2B subunit delta
MVEVVPDAACGAFVADVGAVVMGADTVLTDGSVVNKVGSFPLALVAREAGLPVYVLAETLKIAAPQFRLVLEPLEWPEMSAEAAPGVRVRTLAFERVPSHLITAIISEDGVLGPPEIEERARLASDALATLAGW